MNLVWIAVFGLIGVFTRYGVDLLTVRAGVSTHWGTFSINLLGSFVVTFIYVAGAERNWITPEIRTGLMVGLMGGFTTFSSYALQSALLLQSTASPAETLFPWIYILLSPIGGIGLAFLGLHFFRYL